MSSLLWLLFATSEALVAAPHQHRHQHQHKHQHHRQHRSTHCLGEADDGLVISEARSVAEVLSELWACIVRNYGPEAAPREATAMVFSECEALKDRAVWAALFEHLECAKDICEYFGTKVAAIPSDDDGDRALVLKPYGKRRRKADPDDDDEDWDLSPELRAMLEADSSLDDDDDFDFDDSGEATPSSSSSSSDDPLSTSKRWVEAVVSGAGVCPFSVNAERAGLPVGNVRYEVSSSDDAEAAYAAYWSEVGTLLAAEETAISTTLLILSHPRWSRSLEDFETLGTTVAQALETGGGGGDGSSHKRGLGLESDLQLVFFHPQYVFRDGRDRAGEHQAANYARRSPYPMINVLRTSQVRAAQRGLPTALVYQQNEQTLDDLGADVLADMLKRRDWAGLGKGGHLRVDRTRVDVLRIAQDLMRLDDDKEKEPDLPVPLPPRE